MKQFLRETWQLWYWAHFTPSKLQQRINEWGPIEYENGHRRNTYYAEIFLFEANSRFLAQFFFLLLILSTPLILMIAFSGQVLGLWFVVTLPLIAYGLSVWSFLPLALHLPCLFTLFYLANGELLKIIEKALIPLTSLTTIRLISGLSLIAISWIWYRLWLAKPIKFGNYVFFIGNTISYLFIAFLLNNDTKKLYFTFVIYIFSWFLFQLFGPRKTKDAKTIGHIFIKVIVLAALITSISAMTIVKTVEIIVFIFSFVIVTPIISAFLVVLTGNVAVFNAALTSFFASSVKDLTSTDSNTETKVDAESHANANAIDLILTKAEAKVETQAKTSVIVKAEAEVFIIATFIALVVAVTIAIVIAAFDSLPLFCLSFAGWLIGSSFANRIQHRWGIGIAVVLVILSIDRQNVSGLFVIPPTLIGYYRLFPDYPILILMSLWETRQLRRASAEQVLRSMYKQPPYTHELLWLRLPYHAYILTTTFKYNFKVGIDALQKMRNLPHRGLRRTAQRALPQIVSDQLLAPTSVNQLISTSTPKHPVLPLLVPYLYQPEDKNLSDETLLEFATTAPIDVDIMTMLPRLQSIARDVGAALEGGSAFLRERGLEGTFTKLARLQGKLPGMGLDASAIPRWRAVLEHWQAIIQDELEQQQVASQGEVLNPFQSGNPLRINRKYLFKGRQQFADEILPQVLNRSRPTLVLHGSRRCGKSSFLYNLPRLLPSDVIPVYFDLQNAASISSEANFCYGLVRAIGRDMRSQGLTAPTAKRGEFRADPYAALEDWLDEAEQVLEQRRILFCLDEFEKLGAAIKEGKISLTLFDQLRHLIQHREELSFLFCGVQTLAELGPNWSSYFISIEPVEMLYLELNEARELLEDPDPEFNLGYDTGIVDEVLRITRCQPYLVQLIGEAMVKQANQHQTRLITPRLLEAALESALTAGEPYFTNLWSEYTGEFDKPAEVAAGQRVLHALAHGLPLPITDNDEADGATRAAIRRMVRYHVIEQDEAGAYRFEVPFVERWVRERAVLE